MIKKATKSLAALVVGLFCASSAMAQDELLVSQYVHNQFAVCPAFAGSRDGLSLFGSFRKQWASVSGTPQSALVTANTPLRNEKFTAGIGLFEQSIHETNTLGLRLTAGYRTHVSDEIWLGLALQPGVLFRSTDWSSVNTMEKQDVVFSEKQSGVNPLLGFGASLYSHKFFLGLAVNSFFVSNDFERRKAKFAPAEATYIATAGYDFGLSDDFSLAPSVLFDYNKALGAAADVTVTGIFRDKVWVDLAFRTTKDATVGVAYKPSPQFKVAYSYTLSLGDLRGYNSGSHEVSIQYDLVYRVKTVGHRFY